MLGLAILCQLGALTVSQYKTWGAVVKANNIRAD